MTVKELKSILKDIPEDLDIICHCADCSSDIEIEEVRVVKDDRNNPLEVIIHTCY